MRTLQPIQTIPLTNIVGIDLSLTATGLCSRSPRGGYSTEEFSPKKKVLIARWVAIRKYIRDFLPLSKKCFVFIEGYAFAARSRSVTGLAEIGGIIRMDLYDHGIEYIEIAPTMLKKFVTGKGNVKKDLILKEVYRRWNMDLESHNMADAYGLVKLGEAAFGLPGDWTKDQLKIAKAINNQILNRE